jgi:hypothetical protein
MDFSGLVKGVQDFWDFIWPPIICLLALFGIIFFVAPLLSRRILSKLASWKPADRSQIQFIKVSKRFGIDKLLPIICAFFLIFFLDAVRNIVVMGGQSIPPVISYSPSGIILEDHDNSTVRCLWESREEAIHLQKEAAIKAAPSQKAGDIANASPSGEDRGFDPDPGYGVVGFEDISYLIDQAVADAMAQHKDAPAVVNLHYAEEKVGTAHMIFSGLKFIFLYTLIVGYFEMRISPIRGQVTFRTVLFLVVIMVGTFVAFLHYLKMTENAEHTKIYVTQTFPIKGSLDCEAPDSDKRDLHKLYDRAASQETSSRTKWWSLQFPSTEILTWSWKQLSGDHPGSSYTP